MRTPTITRRHALATIAAAAVAPRTLFAAPADLSTTLNAIETKSKGRLGVTILFPDGKRMTHRGDERFPMCSTFKFLEAAVVLQRVDAGKETLDRSIQINQSDLLEYAPVSAQHVGGSLTVAELCKAAITVSDNTAANLLMASFGGPPAITAFARSIGDTFTRLDRTETTLNEGTPGDPRDTTTPNAMVGNLQRILFGDVLKPASRQQLTDWMLANTTGKAKFVAGLPTDWKVADKTGAGGHGSNNDIGVLYPPTGKPILIASYLTETTLTTDEKNAIHADVARSLFASMK
ncbi:MAG: class A beta-lactamase [Edaphobacter sp.]|uniref:class A beta-lactamase n=1 Tax=Edaphobacter sp. TaxID=1934404 RepID=UPI002391CC1D|nr:class A beta-lactamase [Edaphobacter sp.]MDE1176867.1 class A beta-lactamase [Edaphobacter sp.]